MKSNQAEAAAKIRAAIEQLTSALDEVAELESHLTDVPVTPIDKVGSLIEAHRKAHGLSKGEINLMAGVTAHTMRRFETDPTSMRVDTLLSILETCGMTLYAGPVDGYY